MLNLDYKGVLAVAAVAAVAAWAVKESLLSVAPSVAKAVDPVNPDNVFNSLFNRFYAAVTGSTQSLGADIYDMTHIEKVFSEKVVDLGATGTW